MRKATSVSWSGSLAELQPSAADDRWRLLNPGRALFSATDRFVADKFALVRRDGHAPTPALAVLFEQLDQAGTRQTLLAARVGITRSSMTELVDRAELLGLVERRPDLLDARVRVVVFTPLGLALQQRLRAGVLGAERAMAREIGQPFLRQLKAELGRYLAAESVALAVLAPANPAWRHRSIGRVMPTAARRFAADTLSVVRACGFADVSEAVLGLCRRLDVDGTRLTALAEQARMTKPAMAELIARAEALSLVSRYPDPLDRRARTIRFTRQGLRLLDAAREGVREAERRLTDVTGEPFVAELIKRLSAYAATSSPRPRA